MNRLSLATLSQALPEASRPLVDPRALSVGIVHLGVGAFHRAHQAVLTERAAAAEGSQRWGIAATTQRSASAREVLAPQDGLYGVLERGRASESLQVVGSVRQVLDGAGDPASVVARLSDPAVSVVTLTVTEKGYRRAASGGLDLADPLVAADLAGAEPRTAVGQLVRGLQLRSRTDAGPVTVISCDNLPANGDVLRRLVREFVDALPAVERRPLQAWLGESARFPSCMVDRIVPAATPDDRADASRLLGLEDRAVVVTEPFVQWVIEDDFAAARPSWELAGVVLTEAVAPWEAVKLRMLNATHTTLAYLGALRGDATIAEALHRPELASSAASLMTDDVMPTLSPPAGLDLADYRDEVLARFANPALRHTTTQVAVDGSQKIPLRLLPTVRERLASGSVPQWAGLSVAAWMTYVAVGRDAHGRDLPLDDPLADVLRAAVAAAGSDAGRIVSGLLGVTQVFGADLREHEAWRDLLVTQVGALLASLR